MAENKIEDGEQILSEFAARVQALGGRFSAVACIRCEDWDHALSRGVATGDPVVVLHLFEDLLEAVRQRYGWGPREMEHFMYELRRAINDYMQRAEFQGQREPDQNGL